MVKTLEEISKQVGDGVNTIVTPETADQGDIAPVFGTLRSYQTTAQEGSFIRDFKDYYDYYGGNQTAKGIVNAIANPFIYEREEGFNGVMSESFKSQPLDFQKKYFSHAATARNNIHLSDMIRKFHNQEEIISRIEDPNYDANNIAAILGGSAGALFDTTTFIPVASFGVSSRLSKIYSKAVTQGKKLDKNNPELWSAKILGTFTTGAQFSGAEYLRETIGAEEFVKSDSEVIANVLAAGVFGGALSTVVAGAAAKTATGYSKLETQTAMNNIVKDAGKLEFTPGNSIMYSDTIGGKAHEVLDKAVGYVKPSMALATSQFQSAKDFIFKLGGTALDTKNGKDAAGLMAEMQTKQSVAYYDMTDLRSAYGSYTKRLGNDAGNSLLSEAKFKQELLSAAYKNDGNLIDDFISSGIEEIDNFLKTKVFETNKRLVKEAQNAGLLKGVDPERFYFARRLDEGKLTVDPTKSKTLLARAAKSADMTRVAEFKALEKQLLEAGLAPEGKINKKTLAQFRELSKENDNILVKLDEYEDLLKDKPFVREDYTDVAQDLYDRAIGISSKQQFAKGHKAFKKRGENLDWKLLRELMSDDYDESILGSVKTLIRETQVQRYLGDATGEVSPLQHQFNQLNNEVKALNKKLDEKFAAGKIDKEQLTKQRDKLLKDKKTAEEYFEGLMNRVYDRSAQGDLKHGWVEAVRTGLTALTNIGLLGASVIAQIVDSVNIIDYKLFSHLSFLEPKAKMVATRESLGLNEDTLRRHGVKAMDGYDQRARMMHGESYDSYLHMSEEKNMLGISPKGVTRFFRYMQEKFFNLNLMTPWNNVMKGNLFKGTMETVVNLSIEANSKGFSKLSKNSQKMLKDLGIKENNLKAIYLQYNKNPNVRNWDSAIMDDLTAKIMQDIEFKGVIAPNITDKPLAFDETAVAGFAMLKGFILAALDRYLLRDLRSGWRGFNRIAGRTILGTASFMAREALKGNEMEDDPKRLFLEGFYRSGSFAGIDFLAETLDHTVDLGPSALFGIENKAGRFYNGDTGLLQLAVGPTATIFKDIEATARKVRDGKFTLEDAARLSRYHYALSPFYIHYPIKHLLEE